MKLVAHRAGNDPARARAFPPGVVDVIEADVHLHRGRLEVRHAKRIWFLPILWDRWYLANPFAPPLLLDTVLESLDPRVTLMVDLKGITPGLGRAVRTLVDRHATPELIVSARVWRHLRHFRDRPGTLLLRSAGNRRELRRLLRQPAGTWDGVSVHRELLTPAVVARLRTRAREVWTWPVNTPAAAREVAALGVTGVISDAPLEVAATVAGESGGS